MGPSAIVAASQVGTWAVIASGDWPPSGYPLDDAWIHELVARNLVRHGVLGVNPHLYGSGATSTLWALLLAIGAVSTALVARIIVQGPRMARESSTTGDIPGPMLDYLI